MPVQAAGSAADQDPQSTDGPGLCKATQASSMHLKRKREEDQNLDAAAQPADTAAAINPAEPQQAAPGQPQVSCDAVGASVEVEQQLQEEAEPSSKEDEESAEAEEPRSHPYGVQPWGNFYMSQVPEIRTAGRV